MNKKRFHSGVATTVVLLLTVVTAGFAYAEPIKLPGGIAFTPSIGVDFRYDDNIDNAPDNKVDSWGAVASPRFLLETERGIGSYSLDYGFSRGEYFDSARDNYTDHRLLAEGSWGLGDRHQLDLGLTYLNIEQEFNDRVAEDLDSLLYERDRYHDADANVTYTYGAEGARAQLALTVGHNRRNYLNELRAQDWNANYAGAEFTYRVVGVTNLVTRIDGRAIDYELGALTLPNRDGNFMNYMAGFRREVPTLTLQLLGGIGTRNFDNPDISDYTRPLWDGLVSWRPTELNELTFATDRRALESRGLANFVDAKSAALTWTYAWTDKISSNASFRYTRAYFAGVGTQENIRRTTLSGSYQLLDWLALRGGVAAIDQNAVPQAFAYERHQVFFGFEATP
ncbi:outer membrane beta-barrel protein [Microbulbifer hainanensis]|uniref:outer membrane beta-barrel protein n=1 Tax=Microbulbifer hainanensis TaxID=2735675 RepID=UPI001869691B|nr:outer membrane beta-barrel protein [Microbulbifer hainanensis]